MSTGLALGVLIAIPALSIGLAFGHQFVHLLAGSRMSHEAVTYGTQFFRSLLPGLVTMLLGQTFMGVLQGEGRTGIIATAMVASTVVNTLLDPLFIFVLDMKVAGAGLATTVATTVAAAYVLSAFLRGKTTVPFVFSLRKVRLSMAREVARIGFPQFLSMASMAVSFMLLNKIVGEISQSAMNSWTLAGRLNDLVLIPSFAVAGATVPMIAQNYGRNNLARVRSIYNRNVLIAASMVLCGALVYMTIAPLLFAMMSDVPLVVSEAVRQVRLLALTFIGISVAIVSSSTFQAIGKPMAALVLSVLRMGVVAVPLAFLCVYYAHMGMNGVFLGMGVSSVLVLPIAYGMVRARLSRLTFRSVVDPAPPMPVPVENL